MSKTLYLECYSGISGDMTVAALLDLGVNQKVLLEALNSLPLTGYSIEITRVLKSGIDACDFNVKLEQENHDHDMAYLHGHEVHHHEHSHGEHHHHDQEHEAHHHDHEHRGMKEITAIIEQGNLTNGAKALALKIFDILANAEAKAHNVPVDQVHFHEVGAVDSIIDIVAVAVCFDYLGFDEVIVPKLYEGRGTVRCQHGILPIPVPAVANILEAYHMPISIIEAEGEFITPTGAAIVAAVKTSEKLPETWSIEKIGIGAGKRQYERASIVRAMEIVRKEI